MLESAFQKQHSGSMEVFYQRLGIEKPILASYAEVLCFVLFQLKTALN
jgi:hypothetical protein